MSREKNTQHLKELLKKLDEQINELDRPEMRRQVANLFFQKAYLLLKLKESEESETITKKDVGEALYQAALRYHIVGADELLATLLQFIQQHDLMESNTKLKWQVERLLSLKPDLMTITPATLPFETSSPELLITSEEDVARIEQQFKLQQKINGIKERVKSIAIKEENGQISRLEAASEYEQIFHEINGLLEEHASHSKELIELAKDVGNKCLLRSLVMQDFDIGMRVLAKAKELKIPLHFHYRMKMEKMLKILDIFRSRKRMVLWIPLEDLSKNLTIDEQILTVMERGYPLNVEENIEIEIIDMYRVDLVRGVSKISVEKVIGDLPRLTPTSVIMNLHDFFPDELLIVFYKTKDMDGLMVVPTGEIERLNVIHLEA